MAKKTLTKTNGKTKNEVEKFPIAGFEKKVPELRKIDQQIADLTEKRNTIKTEIIKKVVQNRKHWEKKGKFYKTFVIQSADGVDATVLFKNTFSKVDPSEEPEMRKTLTDKVFDELYVVTETVSLKPKTDWKELRTALGKKADEYLKTTKHIGHTSEFMERRAEMRADLKPEINKSLDEYTDSVQATPDLRLKG